MDAIRLSCPDRSGFDEQRKNCEMSILMEVKEATIAGDQHKVSALTKQAIDEGIEADQIIQEGHAPDGHVRTVAADPLRLH